MDKSYNKFERAYEIMTELIKESPLPIDPIELKNIETKELKYLKKSLELMAYYLHTIGFEFKGITEEILIPLYEELEKRETHKNKKSKKKIEKITNIWFSKQLTTNYILTLNKLINKLIIN